MTHFTSSFKTLIINNFTARHSPDSNCQKDSYEGLDNLLNFLKTDFSEKIPLINVEYGCSIDIASLPPIGKTKIGRSTLVYISGYIGKKLKSRISNCPNCTKSILSRDGSHVDDDFIQAKEFRNANLVYPGNFLNFLLSHCLGYLFYFIPRICHLKNISNVLKHILRQNINFNPIHCPDHNLEEMFCNLVIRCALFWWCNSINSIIKGNDNKFRKYLSSNPVNIDPFKLHVFQKSQRKRKFINKL